MDKYFYVIRNSRDFGPYSIPQLLDMANRGRILECDKAYQEGTQYDGKTTVGSILKSDGLKVKVQSQGSVWSQISSIGQDVLYPRQDISLKVWREDTKLFMMTLVGLLPATLDILGASSFLTFYAIALYFSGIWGLFFYYLFRTRQVTLGKTFNVFFCTQLFVFVAWDLLGLVSLNPFYWFENDSGLLTQILYYVGGVGLTEEFAKAVPLFILAARAREPLVPQTMVFYGLRSGIAFGVFEGVQYQMSVNSEYAYNMSFLLNISRLTSLPFAHALWAGIAGYFISFALLFPAYKWALRILAISIPALLHGAYDISCQMGIIGWVLHIAILFFSALLLMSYLKHGSEMQSRLSSLTSY